MIVRTWRGQAKAANADAYQRFVTTKVFAHLPAIPGHRGASLLRRPVETAAGDEVEFVAVTLWDSLDAIKAFAGADPIRAVIEPEAQALLSAFDQTVTHYELAHESRVR
jgi:heme-degrading monooxygenase HmoA